MTKTYVTVSCERCHGSGHIVSPSLRSGYEVCPDCDANGYQVAQQNVGQEAEQLRCSASTGGLTSDLMDATTVSCTGLDITIACNDHDTKDAIMAVLVGARQEQDIT